MEQAIASLHARREHLAMGQHRRRRRVRCRLACCGDVPTLETLAAASILLRARSRRCTMRVDQRRRSDAAAAAARASARLAGGRISTRCSRKDKPIMFAFHGYPWLIHRLTYKRHNHDNLHVRGYKEEGTTTHAVRHDGAERARPVPSGHRRDGARAEARATRGRRRADGCARSSSSIGATSRRMATTCRK